VPKTQSRSYLKTTLKTEKFAYPTQKNGNDKAKPDFIAKDFDEILKLLNSKGRPLAFYYFGSDKSHIDKVLKFASFGGGCINDVIMHLTEHNLPFGGLGESGMGSYHGKKSFETFTHYKSVLLKGGSEINLKYPPYTNKKLKLAKFFMGIKKYK
jgi:aldehyde dehydrogenase (NAD+)